MTQRTWRETARAHIEKVAKDYLAAGGSQQGLAQEIRSKYPFGERKNYPYQVWNQEVTAFLSKRTPAASEQERLKAWNAGQAIDYRNYAEPAKEPQHG